MQTNVTFSLVTILLSIASGCSEEPLRRTPGPGMDPAVEGVFDPGVTSKAGSPAVAGLAIGLTLTVEEIYDRMQNEDVTDWLAKKAREAAEAAQVPSPLVGEGHAGAKNRRCGERALEATRAPTPEVGRAPTNLGPRRLSRRSAQGGVPGHPASVLDGWHIHLPHG